MVDVAQAKFGADLAELRSDPCGTLAAWPEVTFQFVDDPDETSTGARCSVAGAYVEDVHHRVPVIQVALAASVGRRAFTALHELGHHFQRNEPELLQGVWDHEYPDLFEDLACDAFASEVLLPDDDVTRHIGPEGPTAEDVIRLFRAGAASRSAVCVRVAQRLPAPGHAVLLTAEGEVFFAASRDLPPLRRGSDQTGDPIIDRGLEHGRSIGRGRFTYRDSIRGDELFIQTAAFDGDLLLVLAVTDHAPWQGFALPSKDVGPQASTYECSDPGCGATYTSWAPRHPKCSVPPCTECGRCACTTSTSEQLCSSCFLVQPAARFDGDRCADCA